MIGLIVATSMTGAFLTGNELNRLCQDAPQQCATYVLGIVDASRALAPAERVFCLSREVRSSQLRDAVRKELEDEPQDRILPAAIIVRRVLQTRFPCKKLNPR